MITLVILHNRQTVPFVLRGVRHDHFQLVTIFRRVARTEERNAVAVVVNDSFFPGGGEGVGPLVKEEGFAAVGIVVAVLGEAVVEGGEEIAAGGFGEANANVFEGVGEAQLNSAVKVFLLKKKNDVSEFLFFLNESIRNALLYHPLYNHLILLQKYSHIIITP